MLIPMAFNQRHLKSNRQIIFENCSFQSDDVPASVAEISFAKEQQSRCLLQPDLMYSLALPNQCGVTARLQLSFQNVTNSIKKWIELWV